MIKLVATTGSFVLGGAGVALVAYLSGNPRAFTHPVVSQLEPSAARLLTVDKPVNVEAPAPDVMVFPELIIQASLPKRQKVSLEPCSEWSDVGAKFIAKEGATGVRSVRQLCEETAPPGRMR